MTVGIDTFEKSIHASCIQLAQAYSVTHRITMKEAKLLVGNYLKSLEEFKSEDTNINILDDIRNDLIKSISICSSDKNKSYLELLKLREKYS